MLIFALMAFPEKIIFRLKENMYTSSKYLFTSQRYSKFNWFSEWILDGYEAHPYLSYKPFARKHEMAFIVVNT
jgi:hypothetical protein